MMQLRNIVSHTYIDSQNTKIQNCLWMKILVHWQLSDAKMRLYFKSFQLQGLIKERRHC
jgi:hypothetical protein